MKSLKFTLATVIALTSSTAWANLIRKSDKTPCSPTVHFKLPDYWERAYIDMGDTIIEAPKADKERWTTIAFADLSINDDSTFYFSSSKNVPCYSSYQCITAKGANRSTYAPRSEGFTCESFIQPSLRPATRSSPCSLSTISRLLSGRPEAEPRAT